MSCQCCLVENGKNIILELVTICIASLLLTAELFATCNVFLLLSNIGSVGACVLGIAALKRQQNYQLAFATVCHAIVVAILYVIIASLLLMAFPILLANVDDALDPKLVNQVNISTLIIFSLGYVLFGLGTSIAIAVKHCRMCREIRQATSAKQRKSIRRRRKHRMQLSSLTDSNTLVPNGTCSNTITETFSVHYNNQIPKDAQPPMVHPYYPPYPPKDQHTYYAPPDHQPMPYPCYPPQDQRLMVNPYYDPMNQSPVANPYNHPGSGQLQSDQPPPYESALPIGFKSITPL